MIALKKMKLLSITNVLYYGYDNVMWFKSGRYFDIDF